MTPRLLIIPWLVCLLLVNISGISAADNPIQLSKSVGGPRGTKFSDKTSVTAGQRVRSIAIYVSKRVVNGISLSVTSPKVKSLSHGGQVGKKTKLVLKPKEYITSMEAHWGTVFRRTQIVYLCFNTSVGNSISAGFKTKNNSMVKVPKGFQLGGFYGLGDKEIVKLGAIWTRISASAKAASPTSIKLTPSASSDASESSSVAMSEAESSDASESDSQASAATSTTGSDDTSEPAFTDASGSGEPPAPKAKADSPTAPEEGSEAASADDSGSAEAPAPKKKPATSVASELASATASVDGSGSTEAPAPETRPAVSSKKASGAASTKGFVSAEAPAPKKKAAASAASEEALAAASTEDSATSMAMASAATSADASDATSTEASTAGSEVAASTAESAAEPKEGSTAAGSEVESTAGSTTAAGTEAPAATTMTVEDSIQLSELFGGPHGTNFSDQNFVNSGQTVSSISIHAGERLDGITMEISAPKTFTFTHGGTGGDQKLLKLDEGEFITSMEVHWSKNTVGSVITKDRTRIFYISFQTSAGNSLSGGAMTEQKTTLTAPEGFQLAGIFGREGKEIDSLGAIWASIELVTPPPTPAPSSTPALENTTSSEASADTSGSGSMTVFIPENTQAVQLSESFGGTHGKQFSDQLAVSSGMTITSVTIRASERLDGVTLEVSAPKKMTFTHGGAGGKENTLTLENGEYITSIEAHLDKKRGATRVFYLSLTTNKGNSISGGTQTEFKGSAKAPEGYQLGGFFGRFGDEIDLIGAVWSSIATVNETVSGPVSADEDIMLSAVYGGPHGNAFSDMSGIVLGKAITSITLRGEEILDVISVQVVDPPGVTWEHGGSGGEGATLALGPDEYINSMEIHWGKRIGRTRVFFVNFNTTEGNSVSAGTKTAQSATETAPEGFQLSGFFGRAEDEVYQLGAIWTRIEAKQLLLTDVMDTEWYGDIIRNWVGPTIGTPKDSACYRKTREMDSKNVCPLGYGRDDDDCIVQCPMAYPVECFLECIPQNDDCAIAVLQKIAAVAGVAFNAATAGVFGNIKTAYKGAKRVYMCAANVISVIKSLIYYFRFVQTTAPQGDTGQLLAVAYQSNVVLVDLPVAICACMGQPAPPRLILSSYVMMAVQFIVKQTIINGENSASSVTEVEDYVAANTSCGYELKKLTDRTIFAVNDIRNKTPGAAVDDIRVTISRSALVQHDIPRVTNNCMKEMMANKTKQAAFENRDLLRKTLGVIIDQLIDTSTTDLGKNVAEKEYMMEVANFGLAVLGGLDPTGIMWMVSQFVQPICGPTSFIGEIDDGNLYDALGMWTVDEAFVGSYGSWTKKGDGVVSISFESIDKEDVTVVIYSGGDEYAKVDIGAGDTVKWTSTVSKLQAKTLYLDRWRPGLFGLPGKGGGSLLLWVPQAAEGGHLTLHVRINDS